MCQKYAFIYEIKPLVEINKIEMVSNISCQMLLLKMGCIDMSFLKQTLFTYMHLLITIFSLYKIRNYYTDRYKGLFMLIDFYWYIKTDNSMKKIYDKIL